MFATLGYWICVPFAWLVRVIYNLTGSYGLAIIFFTVILKLILLPFQLKSKKSMIRMSRMSGKMQEIQKKYANNQMKMNEEIQKLYEEEGVNPMSGCLWSFLPLPILIALYSIIRQPVTRFMYLSEQVLEDLVQKVSDALTASGGDISSIIFMRDGAPVLMKNGFTQLTGTGQITLVKTITEKFPEIADGIDGWINLNYNFIGLDLAAIPSGVLKNFNFSWASIGLILIPILAGASQFLLSRLSMKQNPQADSAAASSTKSMMYTMPLFSVFIAFTMPAALGLYWIAQSGLSFAQEWFMGKFFNQKLEEEENARAAAIEADRKRRVEEGLKQQALREKEAASKPKLKERQQAAREAKKNKANKNSTNEAGRVGDRPYARGRSYQADRYGE